MKKNIIKIIISAFLILFSAIFLQHFETAQFVLFIVSYLIVGYDIIFKAIRNIIHGDVFNENFLMAIASLAASIIGEETEGIAVMLFYQVGEMFQEYAVDKSRKTISSLLQICPDKATVIRNGKYEDIYCEDVEIGETIIIKPGERIPLDAIVTSGETSIDTSAVTGESVPRFAKVGDEILSGCINESNAITAKVIRIFSESTASMILEMVENAQGKKSKSEKFITKSARFYTPFVVFAALFMAIIPPLIFGSLTFRQQIYKALSFLVASCPCALVISVPLAFFGGIGNAAKCGILIKGGNYLEALANSKIFVFDKTGTMTKGVFDVMDISSESLSKDELLRIAAHCECFSNHPVAVSIKRAYEKELDKSLVTYTEEFAGLGVCSVVDGIRYYAGNSKLMEKVGHPTHTTAFEITTIHLCTEDAYLGYISFSDEVKPDSKKTIGSLKQSGIKKTVMLTGDSKKSADVVATQIGIDEVYAYLTPGDKLKHIEKLLDESKKGEKVVFVGDGINDTPALSRADIGVSMGISGTDAAIAAADVVIMTDEPSKLVDALKISKYTLRIVKQNIIFSLFVKALILVLCVISLASMWAAVFADVGVSVIAILNAIRVLRKKY